MTEPQTAAALINCTLSDLVFGGFDLGSATASESKCPFQLGITLRFSDNANGALVNLLLPLGLTVRVTFYAKLRGPKPDIQLGDLTLKTQAEVEVYNPNLAIDQGLAVFQLIPREITQLIATVRVGTTPFAIPSLLRGYYAGPPLQVEPLEPQGFAPPSRKLEAKAAAPQLTAEPASPRLAPENLETADV